MKRKEFKVGDKVTFVRSEGCVIKGNVIGITEHPHFPVVVLFENTIQESFCQGGKWQATDGKSLYHGHNIKVETKIIVKGEELPEKEIETVKRYVNMYSDGSFGEYYLTPGDAWCNCGPEAVAVAVPVNIVKEGNNQPKELIVNKNSQFTK
jgi:hypothetical protein